jgi:hypothetical protein
LRHDLVPVGVSFPLALFAGAGLVPFARPGLEVERLAASAMVAAPVELGGVFAEHVSHPATVFPSLTGTTPRHVQGTSRRMEATVAGGVGHLTDPLALWQRETIAAAC